MNTLLAGQCAMIACEEIQEDGKLFRTVIEGLILVVNEVGVCLYCADERASGADDAPGPCRWFIPWRRVLHIFVPVEGEEDARGGREP